MRTFLSCRGGRLRLALVPCTACRTCSTSRSTNHGWNQRRAASVDQEPRQQPVFWQAADQQACDWYCQHYEDTVRGSWEGDMLCISGTQSVLLSAMPAD